MKEGLTCFKEIFEEIYAKKKWSHGSGSGSRLMHNKGYIAFLENFLQSKKITSIVDMGCGDWQFSKYINWGKVQYFGYDVVASVISKNKANYSAPNISFHLYSGDPHELPAADLIIAKDVLQHWSNRSIKCFLPVLSRYKYALLTNCVNPNGKTVNKDITEGSFRRLDLRLPPFNINAVEIFSFTNHRKFIKTLFRRKPPSWQKLVLLVESNNADVSGV